MKHETIDEIEIITKVMIPSCLPVNNHESRHITINIGSILFSKVCLRIINTAIGITSILYARDTVITYKGIHNIITDVFTLLHILFIEGYEILFGVSINELQNVIQSIVVIQELINLADSFSSEDFLLVGGKSHGHGVASGTNVM